MNRPLGTTSGTEISCEIIYRTLQKIDAVLRIKAVKNNSQTNENQSKYC